MRRFSQESWDDARRKVLARAIAEIPFYRDRWLKLRDPAGDAVSLERVEREMFRFFPFNDPGDVLWPIENSDYQDETLMDYVALHRVSRRNRQFVELRSAINCRSNVIAAFGWRRLVLLRRNSICRPGCADNREIDDYVKLRELKIFDLVCDADDVDSWSAASFDGIASLPTPQRVFAKVRPDNCTSFDAIQRRVSNSTGVDECDVAILVFHPLLGAIGTLEPCNHISVNWRRFYIGPGPEGGLIVTDLCRRRPTLVDILVKCDARFHLRCDVGHARHSNG